VEQWRGRDAIPKMRAVLIQEHGLAEAEVEAIEKACQSEVEEAVQSAISSPEPAREEMYKHIYAEDR
jgi:TPP-dependent pyruvate/acetoin dehydrogenase alpha subunit